MLRSNLKSALKNCNTNLIQNPMFGNSILNEIHLKTHLKWDPKHHTAVALTWSPCTHPWPPTANSQSTSIFSKFADGSLFYTEWNPKSSLKCPSWSRLQLPSRAHLLLLSPLFTPFQLYQPPQMHQVCSCLRTSGLANVFLWNVFPHVSIWLALLLYLSFCSNVT